MGVPFSYVARNLATRRATTLLTASGMALVVFVFATVLMLSEGLRAALVQSGSPDNAVVIRRGAQTEVQSGVERAQAAIVESQPEVAFDAHGQLLASREIVVLISLRKRAGDGPANVTIRGVGPQGAALRPQVRLTDGRPFRPGASEVIAGRNVAARFQGAGLGETLRFGQREWRVVGLFDAGGSAFDSEIWGDADQLMQAFRRPAYSSVIVRLRNPQAFDAFQARLASDPRLTVETKRETRFYADQSETLARFIEILGLALAVIFSAGATIGAMITMYAAVANRTQEIGTLRALGFTRRRILTAFLAESLLLALIGGVIGVVAASFMQVFTLSTMNWQTFAEIAFGFRLTPRIVAASLGFALAMGVAGGFLPALRAARLNIVDALRAA
ncbi:ABC transporter permease [Thiobacter aerophilum]|uniref:ABC transporter permease n=1 Tax=Thiobacter aerophilum TaxID=3121275 RepID=A0ABV0EE49_9BURK